MTYSEQLAERKQAAAELEAMFVAHFGPEAKDYKNWDRLWKRNWMNLLTNPAPSENSVSTEKEAHEADTYDYNSLPPIGGNVSDKGMAFAYPPSIYSEKFSFYFAEQIAKGEADVSAMVDGWLEYEDDIDCDRLAAIVGEIDNYLYHSTVHFMDGTGNTSTMPEITLQFQERFFQSLESKKDAYQIIVSLTGLAIPNRSVIRAEVARGVLLAVKRQIEVLRQQWQAATASQVAVSSSPAKQKAPREQKIAKLAQGIEPGEVQTMLTNLGLGSTYDNPGEWAAAFRALLVAGVLTSNAPSAFRWAVQYVRANDTMLETFKKAWQNELSEAGQFANDAQKTVFRNVLASAQRLLSTKGHE